MNDNEPQDPFETRLFDAEEQLRTGDSAGAELIYREILREEPGHAGAHFGLGILHQNFNAHEPALEHLRRAVEAWPRDARARFALAGSLFRVKRLAEAAEHIERIIHEQPDIAEAHNLLGIVTAEMEQGGPAERHFLQALALRPDFAEAHKNLGTHYAQLGRLEEAREHLKKAIDIRPDYADAWWQLASITDFAAEDDAVRAMQAAYRRDGATAAEKSQLAFALGKAFHDLRQYSRAFDYWREGNALRRALSRHDVEPRLAELRAMKRIFSSRRQDTVDGDRVETPELVFIVGMPRSGSSLVEQILASHSSVYGAGELSALDDAIRGAVKRFPDDLRKLSAGQLTAIRGRYLDAVADRCGGAAVVTDKMLGNFLHIGMIRLLFPGAHIVHCCRDPMDTALSCYMKPFIDDRLDFTCDLTDLGRYYRHYLALMAHWNKIHPSHIRDLHYESLVADPGGEIRGLLEFCGLPFEKRCLAFYETERPVRTASAAQVRRPIHDRSVRTWTHYERELAPFATALNRKDGAGVRFLEFLKLFKAR